MSEFFFVSSFYYYFRFFSRFRSVPNFAAKEKKERPTGNRSSSFSDSVMSSSARAVRFFPRFFGVEEKQPKENELAGITFASLHEVTSNLIAPLEFFHRAFRARSFKRQQLRSGTRSLRQDPASVCVRQFEEVRRRGRTPSAWGSFLRVALPFKKRKGAAFSPLLHSFPGSQLPVPSASPPESRIAGLTHRDRRHRDRRHRDKCRPCGTFCSARWRTRPRGSRGKLLRAPNRRVSQTGGARILPAETTPLSTPLQSSISLPAE